MGTEHRREGNASQSVALTRSASMMMELTSPVAPSHSATRRVCSCGGQNAQLDTRPVRARMRKQRPSSRARGPTLGELGDDTQ